MATLGFRGAAEDEEQSAAKSRPRGRVAPDVTTEIIGERASNNGVLVFSAVLFVGTALIALAVSWLLVDDVTLPGLIVALVVGLLAVSSCHVAQQWERVVVLRLGRFNRVSGPGLFWTWPVVESNTLRIDTRTRVTTFYAEETLTADLVPMNVDAVLFWHVWDAKDACVEVGDFTRAVEMSAQTALRDALGRAGAAEVAIRREQLDRELKRVLEEKVAPWGVTILSVEIRNILLPKDLQETMSLEAQAEQRKKARIILMEAEQDIYEILEEMKDLVGGEEAVSRLRTMHLLNESLREGEGTVLVPSAFAEGFNGADGAADALKSVLGK